MDTNRDTKTIKAIRDKIDINKNPLDHTNLIENLKDAERKWLILEEYLRCKLSIPDIAIKYSTSPDKVERFISKLYKNFQNVRETKMLLQSQRAPEYFKSIQKNHLDPDRINREFLSKLSDPLSPSLTNEELIYCELFVSDGDSCKAIEESGLSVGIDKGDRGSYQNAIKLRDFYLRKKENIKEYILFLQRERVKLLETGKSHIQSELLALVEKLRNNGDPKLVPSLLKAIELIGRSIGAFEDKQVIEHVHGDDALDRIISKAKSVSDSTIIDA